MASALGLYLAKDRALAVRVSGNARKATIDRVARIEFEMPTFEDVAPGLADELTRETVAVQLRAWLKREKMTGAPIALAVDDADVIFRELRVEFLDRRQIDKVVTYQVEGVISSIPVDDLAVGYTVMRQSESESYLLISAAHRRAVSERVETLEKARLSAAVSDSLLGGALNLRGFHPVLAKVEAPVLWMHFEGVSAVISVIGPEGIYGMRSIRIPLESHEASQMIARPGVGGAADQMLARPGVSDPAAAEDAAANRPFGGNIDVDALLEEEVAETARQQRRAQNAATATSKTTQEIQAFTLNAVALRKILTVEVRRMLLTSMTDVKVQRAVITGLPLALHTELDALKTDLGLRELVFDELLDVVIPTAKDGTPKLALDDRRLIAGVAGVAVKLLGKDLSEVDFLTGDLSPTDTFDEVKSPMAVGLTLVAVVLALILVLMLRHEKELDLQLLEAIAPGTKVYDIQQGWQQTYENAEVKPPFPMGATPRQTINNVANAYNAEINAIAGGDKRNFPPTYDADQIWAEVLKAIDKSTGRDKTGKLKFRREHFHLFNLKVAQTFKNNAAGGTVTFDCTLEGSEVDDLRDALQAIRSDNPAWDGVDPNTKTINLFQSVNYSPVGNKTYERGTRWEGGREVSVAVRKYAFTAELTEAARKTAGSGRAVSRGRGR